MRVELLVSLLLQLVNGYVVVDDVFINGHGPYRFIVDTGAQSTSIDAGLARTLNLTPSYRVSLSTQAGEGLVPATRVGKFAAGAAVAADLEVVWYDFAVGDTFQNPIAGILGQNFLSRFEYLLDYKNRKLTLGSDLRIQGERIPFRIVDGRIAVPVRICSVDLIAILDSGSPATVVPRTLESCMVGKGSAAHLKTRFGTREVRMTKLRTIDVGGTRLREVPAAVAPGTSEVLLPTRILDALFVSFAKGYIVILPNRTNSGSGPSD